jgi:glycine C-acetyltransferase
MPPAVLATVLEALAVIEEEPERRQRLWDNTRYLRAGLRDLGFEVGQSETQIIPLMVRESERTMRVCQELLDRGVFAQGIRYPSVPRGTERIRLTVTASHSTSDLDTALITLAEVGRSLRLVSITQPTQITPNSGAREERWHYEEEPSVS